MKKDLLLYLNITFVVTTFALNLVVLILVQHKLICLQNFAFPTSPVFLDVSVRPATMFGSYLKDFGKHYTGEELMKRFGIFKNNLNEISRMNRESGARFGLTKFSDMKSEELMSTSSVLTTCEESFSTCGTGPFDGANVNYYQNETIKEKFDWRNEHYVGPVLDQKKCEGCWAFGIVETMETQAAIKKQVFGPRLSVQELIDCSQSNLGCDGGNVALALRWLCTEKWRVVTEEEYPLKDVTQTCKYKSSPPVGVQIKQFRKLCHMNETDILRLVYFHGPLLVVVNAMPWIGYTDGVIQRACIRTPGSTRDHVVQIVGYDLTAEHPHYIVRNSWGEDFGIGGYVMLAIGSNVCGVADEVVTLDVY